MVESVGESINDGAFVYLCEVEREADLNFAAQVRGDALDELIIDLLRGGDETALHVVIFQEIRDTAGGLADGTATLLQIHIVLFTVRTGGGDARVVSLFGGALFHDCKCVGPFSAG